jgi:hypothetical protein
MNRIAESHELKPDKAADQMPRAAYPSRTDEAGWLGPLALVALPAICCGLLLMIVALLASGAGAWLAANRSLLAIPAAGALAVLLALGWARRTTSR